MFGFGRRRKYNALRKHVESYFASHTIHEHKWHRDLIFELMLGL